MDPNKRMPSRTRRASGKQQAKRGRFNESHPGKNQQLLTCLTPVHTRVCMSVLPPERSALSVVYCPTEHLLTPVNQPAPKAGHPWSNGSGRTTWASRKFERSSGRFLSCPTTWPKRRGGRLRGNLVLVSCATMRSPQSPVLVP